MLLDPKESKQGGASDDLSKSKNGFCMTAWKLIKGTRRNEKAELRVTENPSAFEAVKVEDVGRLLDRDSTVFRMTKGCTGALIAFSRPGRRVYKITVSDSHSIPLGGMTIFGYMWVPDEKSGWVD